MWLTTLLFGAAVVLFFWILWDRKQKMSKWKSMGITGPEPHWLMGNIPDIQKLGINGCFDKWTKEYGKIYGYYEGPRPVLVTSDPDMAKQILVKNFSKFHSRKQLAGIDPNTKNRGMFHTLGDRWRFQRSVASPTFTAKSMKEMSPLINQTVDNLMDVIEEKCQQAEPFDIYSDLQKMTLDVIASCAFGVDVSTLKNPDHIMLRHLRDIFDQIENRTAVLKYAFLVTVLFPELKFITRPILSAYGVDANPYFLQVCREIIEERKKTKSDRKDFIHLLLKVSPDAAQTTNVDSLTMTDDDVGVEASKTDKRSENSATGVKQTMETEAMVSQCILFLVAGYETTSTLLAFTSHTLATHPEVLEKIQREIDENFPKENPKPDYLAVRNLSYLNMVINEILRLHPIAQVVTNRTCFEECEINGIKFDEGSCVHFHMNGLHMDPELWGPEDPKDFVPERFLPERVQQRHPMAWMPFGNGPRNCIGMRFALMEAKIALVRVLKKYNIVKCDKTQVPLPTAKKAIIRPTEGVWIRLEHRI